MFSHCQSCLRALTDPTSRRNGFGPECAERLRSQQHVVDAAQSAVQSGACQDSKLIVLGRILKRHETSLMRFQENEIVPEVIVKSLHQIRREFTQRALHLSRSGQLHIPERTYQLAAA